MPLDEAKIQQINQAYQALDQGMRDSVLETLKNYGNPLDIRSIDLKERKDFKAMFQEDTKVMLENDAAGAQDLTQLLLQCDEETLLHALKHGALGQDLRAYADKEEKEGVKYGDRPDARLTVSEELTLKYRSAVPPDAELQTKVQQALRQAKMILQQVEVQLKGMDPGVIPSAVEETLKYHMKWEAEDFTPENLIALGKKYGEIRAGLGNHIQISDLGARGNSASGMVSHYPHIGHMAEDTLDRDAIAAKKYNLHQKPEGFKLTGNIHLSFDKAQNYNTSQLAAILIHEASHKYHFTDDEAYAHGATTPSGKAYENLSKQEAANNADSYSMTAVSLQKGKLIKDTYKIKELTVKADARHSQTL